MSTVLEEGTYTKQAHTCKFCKQPIILSVHDEYAECGDKFKLYPMAACNECADVRNERRRLEGGIKSVCLDYSRSKRTDALTDATRRALESLTVKYAKMVARWHNMSGHLWDQEFVRQLMDKPEDLSLILDEYWKGFRRTQKDRIPQPQ
jgi:hypothetical protein